jgi:hypothetical protein
MSIEWLDVLKISVSSSVLTALLTWGLNHFFVHRASLRRDARYLAQRLAITLEKFAIDCAAVIADNRLLNSTGGEAGKRHLSLPALEALPADADWKAMAPDLVDRVLSMPSELVLAHETILFWWDMLTDKDGMETETNYQAGLYGFRAWNLASELRRRYGIPASTLPERRQNFVVTLREQHDAANAPRNSEEVITVGRRRRRVDGRDEVQP